MLILLYYCYSLLLFSITLFAALYCNYKYLQAPTKWRNCTSALCKETQLLPRAIHSPTDPYSLQLSAQPVLLSHTQRHQWLTAGRTGAQSAPLVTSLVLQTQVWHCLGAPSSGSLCQGHRAEPILLLLPKLLLVLHTCQILTKFCFLAGTLKPNLLFHCLNHWN